MDAVFYAHSKEGAEKEDWQRLEDHLQGVARLAGSFAESFGSGQWGWLAGLWHDLGKYQLAFQRRLEGDTQKVDHSVVGAVHARHSGEQLLALALVISGHHGGMPDLSSSEADGSRPLVERLSAGAPLYQSARPAMPATVTDISLPQPLARLCPATTATWVRTTWA